MILSDLLGTAVVDHDGRRLGAIVDVRLEMSGTPHQVLADLVVIGILVSPRSRFATWGYERHGERGPWLIAAIQRWLHRGMFLVDWRDVARVDESSVHLRDGFERLDPTLPWPEQASH